MTLNHPKLDTKKSLDTLTDRDKDASHFHNIDENISIELKRSLDDNSLFLGDRCLLCKASSSKVPINIDMAVKSDLIRQPHSKDIDISNVLKIDTHHNKSRFICMPR